MHEQQRRELIPEFDRLAAQADQLRKELDSLIERYQLYRDVSTIALYNESARLTRSLQGAGDTLKRAGTHRIRACLTDWYHCRTDDEEGIPDPVFESITYDGNDTWTVMMRTTTHGRERVIMHSDTATWDDIYSVKPA
jgi:hypothetical protein